MSWVLEHPGPGASPLQYVTYYAATPVRLIFQVVAFAFVIGAAYLWGKSEKEEQ